MVSSLLATTVSGCFTIYICIIHIYLSIYLSTYLSIYLSIYNYIYNTVCFFFIAKFTNQMILSSKSSCILYVLGSKHGCGTFGLLRFSHFCLWPLRSRHLCLGRWSVVDSTWCASKCGLHTRIVGWLPIYYHCTFDLYTIFLNMDDRKPLIHVCSHCFSLVPIVDGWKSITLHSS